MTDQFHDHAADQAPQVAHTATASPKAMGITLILMVLGVLAVIFILVAYFENFMSSYRKEVSETSALSAPTWEAKQAKLEELNNFGWVDANTARQPIDLAIEQVIAEYSSN